MPQPENSRGILGRLGQKLRTQDWFAVTVEVVAVVFGVFLGLQVSNWNDERQERRDERQILLRLHDETGSLLEDVQEERDRLRYQATQLVSAQPVIYLLEPARPLSQGECYAIVSSHIFRMASDELPILDELIATGRFDHLRDDTVKRQLRSYIQFRDRERANHAERTNELYRLHSRHPEAIKIDLVPETEDYQSEWTVLSDSDSEWKTRCVTEEMRGSQAFKNELFDNIGRNSSVLALYDVRERVLIELNDRLETLLDM